MATNKTPDLHGASLRIVQPVNHDGSNAGALLVAVDNIGCRHGDSVYLVKGKEATLPWPGALAPIDAAIVGLVDGQQVAL